MTDEEFERLLDARDVPAIAALPRDEVEAYLERLVQRRAIDHEKANADRLIWMGHILHRAGWARADRALTAILAAAPTEGTLDIVCLILVGLWRSGADPDALRTLGRIERTVAARPVIDPKVLSTADASYPLCTMQLAHFGLPDS